MLCVHVRVRVRVHVRVRVRVHVHVARSFEHCTRLYSPRLGHIESCSHSNSSIGSITASLQDAGCVGRDID